MNTTTTKPTVKSAIDALRTAETALAIACSYRDITRGKDGDCILGALETLRDTLDAHNKSAPGRAALADFGAVVLDQLGNLGAFEDDPHALFDVLVREAEKRRLGTIDRDGTLIPREELPLKPPLHRLDTRELGTVLAGLRMVQEYYTGAQDSLPQRLDDIATNGGEVEALEQDEIDDLCARLNMEGA